MRRENLKQNGDAYIDFLKQRNCRFYAPMDAEHGFSELIQGWTPNINPNYTCYMDLLGNCYVDNDSAYICTLMYNGGTINSGYVNKVMPSIGLTYMFDVDILNDRFQYEYSLQGGGTDSFRTDDTGGVRTTFPIFSREIFKRNGMTMDLNRWYTIVLRYDHGHNNCYYVDNGSLSLVESYANLTWSQTYTTYMNEHVSICCGCTIYIKNVYAFGVAMGDGDLLDIYTHDHQ